MSRLGLLTIAEGSTLLGLFLLQQAGAIDFGDMLKSGMVVVVAFLIPSLLAIRAERKGRAAINA